MALVYEHRVYENDHGGRQRTTLFDLPNEVSPTRFHLKDELWRVLMM